LAGSEKAMVWLFTVVVKLAWSVLGASPTGESQEIFRPALSIEPGSRVATR
jgi:hypothetical protein